MAETGSRWSHCIFSHKAENRQKCILLLTVQDTAREMHPCSDWTFTQEVSLPISINEVKINPHRCAQSPISQGILESIKLAINSCISTLSALTFLVNFQLRSMNSPIVHLFQGCFGDSGFLNFSYVF